MTIDATVNAQPNITATVTNSNQNATVSVADPIRTQVDENKKIEATINPKGELIVKNYTGTVGSIPLYLVGLRDVAAASFSNNSIITYNSANSTFYGSQNLKVVNLEVSGNTNITNFNITNFKVASANIETLRANTITLGTPVKFQIQGFVTSPEVNFDGTSKVTFNTSIANNSVVLGQHTNGDFVERITLIQNSALQILNNVGPKANVYIGTIDATTTGTVGVASFSPSNFEITNRTVAINNIDGNNTTVKVRRGVSVPNIGEGELFLDTSDSSLAFKVGTNTIKLKEVNKTLIDGLGVNAITLAGLSSSQFLRSDENDETTAVLTANGIVSKADIKVGNYGRLHNQGVKFFITPSTDIGPDINKSLSFDHTGANTWVAAGGFQVDGKLRANGEVIGNQWKVDSNGTIFANGTNKVYHDTYHPEADKWTTTRTLTFTGDVTGNNNVDGSSDVTFDIKTNKVSVINVASDSDLLSIPTGKMGVYHTSEITNSPNVNDSAIVVKGNLPTSRVWSVFSNSNEDNSDTNLYFRSGRSGTWGAIQKVWTDANHGPGSGLNADLWDGNQFAAYINQPLRTTDNVTFNNVTATVTGTVSSIANFTTSDLTEGSNLYYTVARANSAIDARVTKAFVEGFGINATQLGGVVASNYLRSDINDETAFNLTAKTFKANESINVADSAIVGATGTRFWISPNDNTKEFTFNNVWTAKGGFRTEGDSTTTGNATFEKNVNVAGNLTVSGNTTFLNTQNLDVTDATMTLNKGQPTPLNDIGLVMQRYASATASDYNIAFGWKESTDSFVWGKTADSGNTNTMTFSDVFATLTHDKKFGIGVVPTHTLHVKAATPSFLIEGTNSNTSIESASKSVINTTAPNGFDFRHNSTSRVVILPSGNVGIKKTSPETSLDVEGDIQIEDVRFVVERDTTSAIADKAIFTFAHATFGSGKFRVSIKDTTNASMHITELLVVHNGTTAYATEYGLVYTGSELSDFEVDISGANVRVIAKPKTTNTLEYKIMGELYKA